MDVACDGGSLMGRGTDMNNPRYLVAFVAALAFGVATLPAANAGVIQYYASLGPEAVGATGSGSVTVDYDDVANTLLINASWSGLSGLTTVSHIHCCTAVPGTGTIGVAVTPGTLPGFPAGTSSGSYTSPLLDLTSSGTFTAGFISTFAGGVLGNADDALLAGMNGGRAYFNIHTAAFPGGEIRGFLHQVPEPQTFWLLSVGMAGLFLAGRRRGVSVAGRQGTFR
jgi:hypothetical protein